MPLAYSARRGDLGYSLSWIKQEVLTELLAELLKNRQEMGGLNEMDFINTT